MQFMILGGNDCHGVSCMVDADKLLHLRSFKRTSFLLVAILPTINAVVGIN